MKDFDIMAALDDEPATLDLTIDDASIPGLICDSDPADWHEFGLDRPLGYPSGDEQKGDFWTSLSGSITSTGDILTDKVEAMIERAKALSASLNPIEKY